MCVACYNETTKGYRVYNPMTKRTWTSKDVHFDETCFPFAPSKVTSNHELDSKAGAWPGDYLPKPHEPSSNPSIFTQLSDNSVDDPTENSNPHFPPQASKLNEQVQESGDSPHPEGSVDNQCNVRIPINQEDTPHACSPILCTYHRRPRPTNLSSNLGSVPSFRTRSGRVSILGFQI